MERSGLDCIPDSRSEKAAEQQSLTSVAIRFIEPEDTRWIGCLLQSPDPEEDDEEDLLRTGLER
jgi:hypothetical protein